MASVQLSDIGKTYGTSVTALSEVDINIEDGEFVVLLGPSGCGKSTLLRIVAGLEAPTVGTVVIGDRTVNSIPGKSRDVAMVFQNYALYPQMTVAENMAFPLRIRKLSKSETRQRIDEVARLLEIDELLGRKPGELSGGQQQRVAMARALVRRPAVLLMDEPLSNLDARLRDQTRKEIRRLQRAAGVTTLYVTHDQTEALTMADRVVVMHKGVIQQIDKPHALYKRPSNAFVASFVGSPPRSLVEGTVADGCLAVGGAAMPLTGGAPLPNGPVQVALRPDRAELQDHDSASSSNKGGLLFDVEVDLAEPLGSETLVEVRLLDGQEVNLSNLIRVKVTGGLPPAIGERLQVLVPPSGVELYSESSGELLWRGAEA